MKALAFCVLAVAPMLGAQPAAPLPDSSPEALRTLMRKVLSNLQASDRNLGDYAYERYSIRREYDGGGKLTSERTILARRAFLDGFGYTQQVQRDGRPVPAEQIAREQEMFRTMAAEWKSQTPEARKAAQEENTRQTAERNAWLKEFPDALDYKFAGEETIDGRVAVMLDCSPRSGYKAANLRARVFEKVRGRIWIDKVDAQLLRADAEVFETVNIGWGVVGRVQKGTRFHIERRWLTDGSWLPAEQTIRFAARVLLFKTIAQEETTRYSEYKHKAAIAAAE